MLIVVDLDNHSHALLLENIFKLADNLASPEVTNVTIYYSSHGQCSADGGHYIFSIKDKDDCEVSTTVTIAQLQGGESKLFSRIAQMLLTRFDMVRKTIREQRPSMPNVDLPPFDNNPLAAMPYPASICHSRKGAGS